MIKSLTLIVLLALAGCSALPPPQLVASPCATSEASYECQVERYHNVNAR
jgi:hypothetical protein